jgi:uncharacterized protein
MRGQPPENRMILEKINADLIATMKDREPSRKEANQAKIMSLRTLLAEVKSFQVNNRKDPTDEEVAAMLQKGIKQFKETLEKAKGQNQAGAVRQDIVDQENAKIALYETFLPAQMGRADIEPLVREAIAQTGAKGPKDMGLVMGALRPKTQGRADGKLVSDIVRELLPK